MPKFKVDENLSAEVAALFVQAGHDAVTVLAQQLGGQADSVIAQACRLENRVFVTLDLGFADIRAYPPADYPGIVVLRLSRLDRTRVLTILRRLLPTFDREPIHGKLWIVSETTVRVRN